MKKNLDPSNILVVGFGNIGARHTQSIVNKFKRVKAHIVEPNLNVLSKNLRLIKLKKDDIIHYSDLKNINIKFDFCIVATSAEPRYSLMLELLKMDIKFFLIEKVVFQSEYQFDKIVKLAKTKSIKIYCNFVHRYYNNYMDIKSEIKNSKITMIVNGDDFGMACDSLHYIDMFEFLTNSEVMYNSNQISIDTRGNKRGDIYKEVFGYISLKNKRNDKLIISSDLEKKDGTDIIIQLQNSIHFINSKNLRHINYNDNLILVKKFNLKYTSELTAKMVQDIYSNKCLLPELYQVKNSHLIFFKNLNEVFGLKSGDLCPIT